MQVYDIEIARSQAQLCCEIGRIIEPSQPARTKIVDLNAIKVDGIIVRNIAVARAIDTGREYMNLMTRLSETLAKGMDRVDGTAIADGWVIARDDMQDPHHQISLPP